MDAEHLPRIGFEKRIHRNRRGCVHQRRTGVPDQNGYSSMVVMRLEQYSVLTAGIELALDEADKAAAISDVRYSADEVFRRARRSIHERKAL